MKKIKIFDSQPDYVFGAGETNTVLLWPDTATVDGDTVPCIRTREMSDGGEIVDMKIFGYDMPTTAEEYDYMITNALPYEIEIEAEDK